MRQVVRGLGASWRNGEAVLSIPPPPTAQAENRGEVQRKEDALG